MKYMNRTVDPCSNFHQYACGNWDKYHQIPIQHSSYGLFHKLSDKLDKSLYELLIDDSNFNLNNKVSENVKILFNSCLNIEKINERKSEPLIKFLKDKLNNFPLFDKNWSPNNLNLEEILSELTVYQMGSLFRAEVEFDLEDTKNLIITISNPELGLSNSDDYGDGDDTNDTNPNNTNNLHLKAYRNYIIEIFQLLESNAEDIEKVVDEIIELERIISNETKTMEQRYTDLFFKKDIKELQEINPEFNWKLYLNMVYKKLYNLNDTNINIINDDTKIAFLTGPNLLEMYNILINTDKRIMANYFNWIIIDQMVNYLDDRFKSPKKKLSRALTGTEPNTKNRGHMCATVTNNKLGMAVSEIYVRKYFDETSKADIENIAKEIKETFRKNLYEYDWIDDKTRMSAELKVNRTGLIFGFPDFLLNQTALNEWYDGIELENGKYFENVLEIRKFNIRQSFDKLEKNVLDAKNDWPVNPTVINAFFWNSKNRIIMPAAFLQPPIYHKDLPNVLKYGAIGAFIGHELTHGFDSDGRTFDENGSFKDWWSNSSVKNFDEKEQCFIERYNLFSLQNKSLNGALTIKENIADNGGIQLSFKVYKNWLSQRVGKELKSETLPGLEFLTPQQLFFLSFAQSWCEYIRPEAVEMALATDPHPPGQFRILGPLQNFDEFSKAYQCKKDSYMNPSKKCQLW